MNLDKIFGLQKLAGDVPFGVASSHRYTDQQGTPAELRLVNPTGWEKLTHGLGVSTISVPAGLAAGFSLGNLLGGRQGEDLGGVLGGLAGLGYGVHSGLNVPQRLVARAAQPTSQEPPFVEASSKLSSALGFEPDGVSLRSVFGFDKAAAPVMAPGLLKRLGASLKGGKVSK